MSISATAQNVGSTKTEQYKASFETAIDIEELVSQYTGDIVAHQLGKVIRFAKKRPDESLNDIVETLKDDLATLLVAPSRSRFFNGGVE